MFISKLELDTLKQNIDLILNQHNRLRSDLMDLRALLVSSGLLTYSEDGYGKIEVDTDLSAFRRALNLIKVQQPARTFYKKGESK